MDESLKKQSEELEQTLNKQLELIKKDSMIYLKIGGIALVSGLATVGAIKLFSPKKKYKGKKKVKNRYKKPRKQAKHKKKRFSVFRNIRNRLFWLLMDHGRSHLVDFLIKKTQGNRGER